MSKQWGHGYYTGLNSGRTQGIIGTLVVVAGAIATYIWWNNKSEQNTNQA